MKIRLLLILTALQFCSLIYAQEEIDPMRFFPSQVGNVWDYYYSESDSYSRTTITQDSVLEDRSKLLFLNYNSSPRYKIDTNYYLYETFLGITWTIYKLDADSGEVWMVEKGRDSLAPNFMAMVTNQYEAYIPELNKQTIIKEITYYDVPAEDTTITENAWSRRRDVLGLDIGLIQIYNIEHGPEKTLTGCIIDEDTLGTLIAIKEGPNLLDISYILSQNYPNPFNPSTTIEYEIKEAGHITLKIYDMLGAEIETLINEWKPIGKYKIRFTADNLAAGVYLYRLTSQNYTHTRKMILLK
jgi:hypothetical protein